MRILFISLDFPPNNFGGSGIYASETVKLLSKRHEVHVMTIGSRTEVMKVSQNLFVHRYASPTLPFSKLPAFLFHIGRNIDQMIASNKIDLIHSNDVEGGFFLHKLPSTVTIHHLATHNFSKISLVRNIKNLPYILMERIAVKKARHIIAVSHITKGAISKKYPYNQHNLSVVYPPIYLNMVRTAKLEQVKSEFNIPNDKVLILAPGVMREERKGGYYLVKALKKLSLTSDNFIIVFTGVSREGNWDTKLKSMARDLQNRVKYVGEVTFGNLTNLLSAADIVVFPSIFEGFGLPVVEAMSMSKPVITTKTGEMPYLINHNVDGFLIETRNIEDIYQYLYKLIRDEHLRNKIGINAYHSIFKKINNDQIITSLESIYTQLCRYK